MRMTISTEYKKIKGRHVSLKLGLISWWRTQIQPVCEETSPAFIKNSLKNALNRIPETPG